MNELPTPKQRLPALLALALPVFAGLIYLTLAGAPAPYVIINAAAFLIAALWIVFGRAPGSDRGRRILVVALLALCFVPLFTGPFVNSPFVDGPSVDSIARWIPLGGFTLHAGSMLFPAIAVLAARDLDFAPPILLTALLAAMAQPDAAFGFAIVFAAVGLHDQSRDWRDGMVAIVGFFAALIMAVQGELPPQPFVERVFADTVAVSPIGGIALLLALAGGLMAMLHAAPFEARARYALAGSLFGFGIMSIMSHYPSVLIGYGAAPILGYGLALGLAQHGPAQRTDT
ncbi:hypothetical protein ACFCW2_10630 [Qipengyuania sp. DSG2-2]|uniref:hypothetical protein n=1 Tax=Qipengyuania sp. DGS2-2 TaxID=3349631 RepID=UPI0036D22F2F